MDNQDGCFQCPAFRKEININCDMEDIYTEKITAETTEMVTKIFKLRQTLLENKKLNQNDVEENHTGRKKSISL